VGTLEFPPVLTATEMRAADVAATRDLGLPTLLLMENAGRGVAEIIRRELAGQPPGRPPRVVVVCGGGSNGGDGLVAARHLARAGVPVHLLLTAARSKIQGDAAIALGAVERMFLPVEDASGWTEQARWGARLGEATVVVDAIFGTGFHGPVTDVPAIALQAMNDARALKIAIDIPSGLDADTGRAAGIVFRADLTATVGAWKTGLLVEAAAPVGQVELVDLGVPVAAGEARCRLLDDRGIVARLPHRSSYAHKGSSGQLLVVAGSSGKTGAALLVGRAALRAGAGLVTIASTAAGQIALDAKVVELMTASYTEGDDPDPTTAIASLTALAKRAQAMTIGPGIPTGARMRALVRQLAARLSLPMVLDADALNALGTEAPGLLAAAPSVRILTPHPGEMGRLLGISISDVQADRLGHARRLAAAAHAYVVLKGARTVIAAPDGVAFLSPISCAALATAGSGDVLSGVIGALLARQLDPLTAAQVGVYVHGLAGQELAIRLGDGVVAGDLPDAIATVISRLSARPAS
jgi:ADP-dependent NAD(P)H-hydrate dehydratase / NAD(P)H-hydrate epimerase